MNTQQCLQFLKDNYPAERLCEIENALEGHVTESDLLESLGITPIKTYYENEDWDADIDSDGQVFIVGYDAKLFANKELRESYGRSRDTGWYRVEKKEVTITKYVAVTYKE